MLSHSDKRSEACACNGAHYCRWSAKSKSNRHLRAMPPIDDRYSKRFKSNNPIRGLRKQLFASPGAAWKRCYRRGGCRLFAPIVCTLPWAKLAALVTFSRCGICWKVEGHCTRLIGPNLGANGVALAAWFALGECGFEHQCLMHFQWPENMGPPWLFLLQCSMQAKVCLDQPIRTYQFHKGLIHLPNWQTQRADLWLYASTPTHKNKRARQGHAHPFVMLRHPLAAKLCNCMIKLC